MAAQAVIVVHTIYVGQLVQAPPFHNMHARACKGCGLCTVKSMSCNTTKETVKNGVYVNVNVCYVPLHFSKKVAYCNKDKMKLNCS